jgi:ribosomal protein S18 acetylase RimI-like enzyme
MQVLDMSPYQPYRPMARTCLTRPIRDKQVVWVKPPLETHPQGGFVGRPLARADIDASARLWRQAYPEVYGSSQDFLLYPEEYESKFALVETWDADARTKPGCMLVVEELVSGHLVAASLMTKFDKNLQVEYTFAGTHPDYRRRGLMGLLGKMMYRMVLASGAEYLTTFLETWHTITQDETLKKGHGWKIAGIFPGNITRWAGGQEEYRACIVYMYQFINDGDKFATRPQEWQLHPEVRRLWEEMELCHSRLGRDSR